MKFFLILEESHCLVKSNLSRTTAVIMIYVQREVGGVKNKNWKLG